MFNGGLLQFMWYLLMVYVWFMVIWMFIQVFADILRRDNLSGWGKAAWIFFLVVLPFIGILAYMIARPRNTEQDRRLVAEAAATQARLSGGNAIDDIARAQELLEKGAINQSEFDALKTKALSA